jgi:hypothetical protein
LLRYTSRILLDHGSHLVVRWQHRYFGEIDTSVSNSCYSNVACNSSDRSYLRHTIPDCAGCGLRRYEWRFYLSWSRCPNPQYVISFIFEKLSSRQSSLAFHILHQLVRIYVISTYTRLLRPLSKARPLGWSAAVHRREYVAHQFSMPLFDVPARRPLTYMQLLALFTAGEGNHNFVRS